MLKLICRNIKSKSLKSMLNMKSSRRFLSDKRDVKTITTIDCSYMGIPKHSAAYLIKEGETAAFIDNNTNNSIPLLMEALENNKVTPENVKYIIITHIHLDHAGGTSLLASKCPNAIVLAHPRAAKHLIDPSKIIEGSKAVYGEEVFNSVYGEIKPIPKERVVEVNDNEMHLLGDRPLRFLHVRGHAKHHFVVHDLFSESIFTGDAFGVSYRSYFKENQLDFTSKVQSSPLLRFFTGMKSEKQDKLPDFLFPSSSPIDFEPDKAHEAVDIIVKTGSKRAFLTHFGVWEDMEYGASQMHYAIQQYENIMNSIGYKLVLENLSDKELESMAHKKLGHFFEEELLKHNIDGQSKVIKDILKLDIELNAQGIVVAAKRNRAFYEKMTQK